MDRETTAREAILQELKRRYKEDKNCGVKPAIDISRFFQPQTNYYCGAGKMRCPICNAGELQYLRSAYNGHVTAQCSTDGCVAWRE